MEKGRDKGISKDISSGIQEIRTPNVVTENVSKHV